MQKCYHCSEECEEASQISHDDKLFCCLGCKTVYELLVDNQLGAYYDIEKNPGAKPAGKSFDSLLNPTIADRFIEFQDDEILKTTIFIPNIHCSSCIWLLENLHQIHQKVIKSEVHFVRKELSLTLKNEPSILKEIFEFLDRMGYTPALETEKKNNKPNKRLLLQLAVAGFCFGNIMLLSFPEYLFTDDIFINEFRNIFSYIILGLSLPIILYSSKDYLVSAINGIKYKKLNIDIPISIGILTLYVKSFVDIINQSGPGYMDSFAGFIFFLLLGKWFQSKTYQAMSFERDFKSYFPMAVERLSTQDSEQAPIEDLKTGDLIVIKNEEIIPVDATLISDYSRIDYSFVTGESSKKSIHKNERIFAGGKHFGSSITLEVHKPVNQSYLTQLWNSGDKEKMNEKMSEQEKLSGHFIIALLFISLAGLILWSFIDPSRIVSIITAILIVACPCALAISEPFTYGNTLRAYSKLNLYIKNTRVIEELSMITDIVFDKTGTITENQNQKISYEGKELTPEEINEISSIIKNSSHPLSRSLFQHLKPDTKGEISLNSYDEIVGSGLNAVLNGKNYKIGSEKYVMGDKTSAATSVYISSNNQYLGKFLFSNQYREHIEETISDLSKSFNLHVLTGDNNLEESNLQTMFGKNAKLNFEQLPTDKKEYIERLKSKGASVLMIGDGLNDAGALKSADVGLVVTEDVFNFSPACDGILRADRIKNINSIISFSKKSKRILRYCYVFSLLYNVIGLSFAFTGNMSPLIAAILMPISSISIVLFTTLTTRISARKTLA